MEVWSVSAEFTQRQTLLDEAISKCKHLTSGFQSEYYKVHYATCASADGTSLVSSLLFVRKIANRPSDSWTSEEKAMEN